MSLNRLQSLVLTISCLYAALPVMAESLHSLEKFYEKTVVIEAVTYPKDFGDILSTKEVRAILSATANYYGVPSTAIAVSNEIMKALASDKEEEHDFVIPINVNQYRFCGVKISTGASIPLHGSKKPCYEASAASYDDGREAITIHTWTKKRGVFEGRSKIRLTVEVVMARADLWQGLAQQGKCQILERQEIHSSVGRCVVGGSTAWCKRISNPPGCQSNLPPQKLAPPKMFSMK